MHLGLIPAESVELLPFRSPRTTVSPHEAVIFYPSFGYRRDAETWAVVVQGCVYHQRITWLRRKPVLSVIRRAMRVGRDSELCFRQRMRQFLVHFSAGRQVTVQLGGEIATLGPTEAAGLFRGEMQIPARVFDANWGSGCSGGTRWVRYHANLPEGDSRSFVGEAQLLEGQGVSIISDVDDTLKHSNVPDRGDLFQNTFVREFVPIPGMPELYRECALRGAAFHYVSGSPWQLYEPLAEFWQSQGYPAGSFHLKRFRLRESASKLRRMSPQRPHKTAAIDPIVTAFPERKFILIGDSGEQDPEIYAHFLRERPQQIVQVFIRAVRGIAVDLPRLQQTFRDAPRTSWTVYETADQIHEPLLQWIETAKSTPGNFCRSVSFPDGE